MIWKRKAKHQTGRSAEFYSDLVLFAAIAKSAGVAEPHQRASEVLRRHLGDPRTSASAQSIVHELISVDA